MDNGHQTKLEKWGLAPLEAQVYLALVRSAQSVGASAIATAAGIPRPSVYPVLKSLVERGLIENGEGYGSRFAAHPPEEALPRLIAAEKEHLLERERLTADLVDELQSAAEMTERKASHTELIEIIRDPRVANQRVQKLQAETEREVDVLVKPPMILQSQKTKGNPAQSKSLRRGIRHRAIYESTVLEHENIAPHLKSWIESGEQAREFKGELPLKLALFDSKVVWMPLEVDAQRHPVVSILIRHPALGRALRLLFDYLWKESTPIKLEGASGRKRNGSAAGNGGKK